MRLPIIIKKARPSAAGERWEVKKVLEKGPTRYEQRHDIATKLGGRRRLEESYGQNWGERSQSALIG